MKVKYTEYPQGRSVRIAGDQRLTHALKGGTMRVEDGDETRSLCWWLVTSNGRPELLAGYAVTKRRFGPPQGDDNGN